MAIETAPAAGELLASLPIQAGRGRRSRALRSVGRNGDSPLTDRARRLRRRPPEEHLEIDEPAYRDVVDRDA